MKKIASLFAIIVISFVAYAQEIHQHSTETEHAKHQKHFNNFTSAEVPFTFLADTTLVGVKLNLHMNYFQTENSKYCFTTVFGFEHLNEDTVTHIMFGAGRKFLLRKDAVLEGSFVLGVEQPFIHPRFGVIISMHSNSMECFMTLDYGFRSKFFYRAYTIWYPEKHFGFGGEIQKHSPSGFIVAFKPIPRLSIRCVNGVDLGYLVKSSDNDVPKEGSGETKSHKFKFATMIELHVDF